MWTAIIIACGFLLWDACLAAAFVTWNWLCAGPANDEKRQIGDLQ